MTIGEALYVTAIGMGTVLISLLIVSLVINIVKKFVDQKDKAKVQPSESKNPQVSSGALAELEDDVREEEDNQQVVAAITAGLALMLSKSEADQFIVKKITRISQHSTEWGKAGRNDQMKSLN